MSATPADCMGVVVALPAEARSLGMRGVRSGACVRRAGSWVAVSGIGPSRAAHAAQRLLDCGITGLTSWGVAGALDPELAAGDLVLPGRVLDAADGNAFLTDHSTRERLVAACRESLRVHTGALWSSDRPVATAADKRALAAQSDAIAVDMEAAAVARVAVGAGLPFLAVKAICDPADRELPARMLHALDGDDGGPSLRMLAAIVLGGPATWSASRSLARDFFRARRTLGSVARLGT